MSESAPHYPDPESREPVLPFRENAPLFCYQVTYPLGNVFAVIAPSMAAAVCTLHEAGIEPFVVTRCGPLVELERK